MISVKVETPPAERRREQRYGLTRLAQAVQHGLGPNERIESLGTIHDLSVGGVSFEADRPLDPDQPVEICVALGEALIDVIGRITHIKRTGNHRVLTGIEFQGLSDADRGYIRDYCHRAMLAPR